MASPETIISSLRENATRVFEVCQRDLTQAIEDKDDFVAEEGVAFFQDWFDTVQGYDITFQDMVDAVAAMETIEAAFDVVRAKLQVVRTR